MINKELLDQVKSYKVKNGFNLYHLATLFPQIFGNFLRMMMVHFPTGHTINLLFDHTIYMKFQVNFGYAIANHNFDYMDNILLEFLESYNYGINQFKVNLKFGEEEKKNFIYVCNSFKGKEWDNIIDDFVDVLYLLLSSGTINGIHISMG